MDTVNAGLGSILFAGEERLEGSKLLPGVSLQYACMCSSRFGDVASAGLPDPPPVVLAVLAVPSCLVLSAPPGRVAM